jgi:hypothetical protein
MLDLQVFTQSFTVETPIVEQSHILPDFLLSSIWNTVES